MENFQISADEISNHPDQVCLKPSRLSRASILEAHLPQLRRYARALTGSLEIADHLIAEMLTGLIQNSTDHGEGADSKVELFKAFTVVWEARHQTVDPPERATAIGEMIEDMEDPQRQAVLLTTAECFSAEQAGQIMDLSEAAVCRLVEQARNELAETGQDSLPLESL